MVDRSNVECWLTDMDGVLVHEQAALPGAVELLAQGIFAVALVEKFGVFAVISQKIGRNALAHEADQRVIWVPIVIAWIGAGDLDVELFGVAVGARLPA